MELANIRDTHRERLARVKGSDDERLLALAYELLNKFAIVAVLKATTIVWAATTVVADPLQCSLAVHFKLHNIMLVATKVHGT